MEFFRNTQFGAVFAMTNDIENAIIAFERDALGRLQRYRMTLTGGSGTGAGTVDPLSSQRAIATSHDGRFLFAVNAGSHTVSSFRIRGGRLALVSVMPSGGIMPTSVAVGENLIYVSNTGGGAEPAAIAGFHVGMDGRLFPIPGSITTLSVSNAQPACATLNPYGNQLVVSERATNQLTGFRVMTNGRLMDRVVTPSNGAGPFGSVLLYNNRLFVAETDPNALSSYAVLEDGSLQVISGSVPNGQIGTCWVAVDTVERFAYTSNTGSGTVSRYAIGANGTLTLLESVNTTLEGNASPIDLAVDRTGRNLYVLNGGQGTISTFSLMEGGAPTLLQVTDAIIPSQGAQGLAVTS